MLEDEDIKIAGKDEPYSDKTPEDTAAAAFRLQLENGNIDKARLLGVLVADKISSAGLLDKVSKQKMILVRFCITNFITVMLQDETLTHTAVDSFEDIMSKNFGISADDDLVSEMYTVFLIAAREKINVAQHIAQTYARFCTFRDDAVSDALAVYSFCSDAVSESIKSLNFVNIKSV